MTAKLERLGANEVRQEFFSPARVGEYKPIFEHLAKASNARGIRAGAISMLKQLELVRTDIDHSPLPGAQVLMEADEARAMLEAKRIAGEE